METDPNESGRAYLIEREEKLAEISACVLVDQRHAAPHRSLRWNLLAVRLPGGAIQHAKLTILLWERHLRLIVTSANLTEPGYRRNLEVASVLDFGSEQDGPHDVAMQAFKFIEALSEFAPTSNARIGPHGALTDFLTLARRRLASWPTPNNPNGSPVCRLLVLLPIRDGRRGPNIVEQLSGMWRGRAPDYATVVSPFYDVEARAIDRLYRRFSGLLTARGDRTIQFVAAGRELADGTAEIDLPERLAESPLRHHATLHRLTYVDGQESEDGNDAARPLHAKVILLERHDASLFVAGSSNFTNAGLGLVANCNSEANVGYWIPSAAGAFHKSCESALPAHVEPEKGAKVSLLQPDQYSLDESASGEVLPRGFDEALFRPKGRSGELVLTLVLDELPRHFELHGPGQSPLLTDVQWREKYERAARVVIPVDSPISGLRVTWTVTASGKHSAIWPVNVTDRSQLMAPAELEGLSLDELIRILASARPVHAVLKMRVINGPGENGLGGPVVDPLKKVDTSEFWLRRMRRLAKALEGLKQRLEQPVTCVESLRWRLFGPLGPIALAKAVETAGGRGAPFLVSEIAETLREVRWTRSETVARAVAVAATREAIETLETMALANARGMPENLATYVRSVFAADPS